MRVGELILKLQEYEKAYGNAQVYLKEDLAFNNSKVRGVISRPCKEEEKEFANDTNIILIYGDTN